MKKIITPVIILILIFSMGVYAANDKQKQDGWRDSNRMPTL